MKSHRRLSSPENPFNFLKIILNSNTQSTGIRLPQKFTEEHGKYLPEMVTLKTPNGDVWEVGVRKSRDEIWLKNGWGKFAEHYGLKFSYMLMFKYDGFSTFEVVICNPTTSEIEYPVKQDATKCPVSYHDDLDDDDDDDENTFTSSSWSEDEDYEIKINDEGECSRKRQITEIAEANRALEEAKANFKSVKPFFMVCIRSTNLTNRGVYTPVSFKRELLEGHKSCCKCLLRLEDDEKMKTYMVELRNEYLGAADWLVFVKDNGVTVGDTCVFELIHKSKHVIGVTILRSGS